MPFAKAINFDRETKDFALYLNGELVGYAGTYLEGEMQLNALVHDILTRTAVAATSDVPAEDAEVVLEATQTTPVPTPAPTPIWVADNVQALQVVLAVLDQRWQRAVLDGDWKHADELEAWQARSRQELRRLCGAVQQAA